MRLTLDDLSKLGALLQGISGTLLIFGGAFAWYRYRQGKRTESIRWLTETGAKFYQFDKLDDKLRQQFEYDFDTLFAPVMEKWLVYPGALTQADKDALTRIDALLNFFEILCYVSEKDRYLRSADREATFQYWLDDVIRRGDDHVFLRLYLQCGFEHLRKRVQFDRPRNYMAVYGTLTRSGVTQIVDPALREGAEAARRHLGAYIGPCRIKGQLFDLGNYPGLVRAGDGSVSGELYELPFGKLGEPGLDQFRAAVRAIDRFEEVDVEHPERSLYVRRFVKLEAPSETAAWVYFLNRRPETAVHLPTGDWERARTQAR